MQALPPGSLMLTVIMHLPQEHQYVTMRRSFATAHVHNRLTGTAQIVGSGWQRQQVGGAASPLPERASRDPASQQLPPDILDTLRLELLLLVAATAVQEADALIDATQAAGAVLPAIACSFDAK